MILLGVKTFVRKLGQNLFIALQLAVTLILMVQIVSSVESRIGLYMPIREFFSGRGVIVGSHMTLGDEQMIKSNFSDVVDVNGAYATGIVYAPKGSDGEKRYSVDALDDRFINAYAPEMESGVWLSEADCSADSTVKAVVTESTYGYTTGDIVEAAFRPSDFEDFQDITIEIVGVIKDDSPILGFSQQIYKFTSDFRDLYVSNNKESNPIPLMIAQKEQLDHNGVNCVFGTNNIILNFNDDISESEELDTLRLLANNGYGLTFTDFNRNNQKYVTEEIARILPLMVCIFILLIVSTVSLNGLSVKSQLKSFSIYYILGAKWRQCITINFISSIITSVIAIIIAATAANVINLMGLWSFTVVQFGTVQLLSCLIVIIINLLASLILPIAIIKSNTPKEIITSTE